MADEQAGLPVADFIDALRAELRTAALAKDPDLQSNVGPVSVEFSPTGPTVRPASASSAAATSSAGMNTMLTMPMPPAPATASHSRRPCVEPGGKRSKPQPRMQLPPSTRKLRLPSAEDDPGIFYPRTLPSNGHQPSPAGVLLHQLLGTLLPEPAVRA
jgi:hypothetical protein